MVRATTRSIGRWRRRNSGRRRAVRPPGRWRRPEAVAQGRLVFPRDELRTNLDLVGERLVHRAPVGNFHQPGTRVVRTVALDLDVAGDLADVAFLGFAVCAVLRVDPSM